MINAETVEAVAGVLSTAAVLLKSAENKLVKKMSSAGAIAPENAVELAGLNRISRFELNRLKSAGLVMETEEGFCYLKQEKYNLHRRKQRKAALAAVAVVAVAVVLKFLVFA